MTEQIKQLSVKLKDSQGELEATVKARAAEQKDQPGVLQEIKEQAEQGRDSARAEVETERKKLVELQLELEGKREEMEKYKAHTKSEADELAKTHLEKYEGMRKDLTTEREKAVNVAINAGVSSPHKMIRKLLTELAERRDPTSQPKECEARRFEVVNQIMWLETRESETLRRQLEAANNSITLAKAQTMAAELENIAAKGELTREKAEAWEWNTVSETLEIIVGHAMFEDHKDERMKTLKLMIGEIKDYTKKVDQSAHRNTSIQHTMRIDSFSVPRELKQQLKEIDDTMSKEVAGRYNSKNKKQDFNSKIKTFMNETAKNAVAGSQLMTKLTALLMLDGIRHPNTEGRPVEQVSEADGIGAEAETVGPSVRITNDAWKESNQYKTLQGSLNKITNERDQRIVHRDGLQCKSAEQAERITNLELKVRKNLTSGTPGVTSVPEPKVWLSPPKRKTQPQIQAKPRCEKRLEDEYAARGSELARTTDAQIKAARERVKVTEEQLRQAQERIVALEEQAQRVEDHAEEVAILREACRVQADDCKTSHEQWGQFHDNQMKIARQTAEHTETELKSKIEQTEAAAEAAAQTCRDAEQVRGEWEKKHKEFKEQHDLLTSQNTQIREDGERLQRMVETLEQQVETLRIENTELSDAAKHTAGSNERAGEEMEKKRIQIEQLQNEISRCKEAEIVTAEAENRCENIAEAL